MKDVDGLAQADVSTVVTSTSGLPLVVERSMFWGQTTYYASHGGTAVSAPATTWYFAEGSQGFFDTYVLLANSGATTASVQVDFLTEAHGLVTRTYEVKAAERFNVFAGLIPELVDRSFSIVVTSDVPIIAERAMYFGAQPFWNGGHESAGVPAPSTNWFHAEGATGDYFDTYILIGNPNPATANVTMTFLTGEGATVQKTKAIPGNSRLTVNVEGEDPLLANTGVSTSVGSDVPVISERAMYWPGPFTTWHEAHNSFGVTGTGLRWGLAEGRVGGPRAFQTYILLSNGTADTAQVRITYLREGGLPPIVKEYSVIPTSRFNVDVNLFVPELAPGERFGAIVESINGVPIAVERAMYNNSGAVTWAAGTNATAVPLAPAQPERVR